MKKIGKEDIAFVLFCVMTATVFAAYRCAAGDFAAYNGDFQNYNIFRRILDGQVQYRDFTNYLGNGIVMINLPLVFLFNSFGECVFITHFTTSIVYSLIVFISFYTITRERKKAYIVTNIIAIAAFVILHMGFYGEAYYRYVYDLVFFEEQGLSMRTTRSFLPFMLAGIFYVIKWKIREDNLFSRTMCSYKCSITIFLVVGFLTIWSNDYGYSCALCLFIIMLLVSFFDKRVAFGKKMALCATAVLSIAAGMFLAVMIVTHGNIMDYISVNAGISKYQLWYYGGYYGKYLTLTDFFVDKKFLVLTVIFIVHALYFLGLLICRKADDYDICKLFLHSVCYGAALIYAVGSGAHSYISVELVTYVLGVEVAKKFAVKTVLWLRKISHAENKRVLSVICVLNSNRVTIYVMVMMALYAASVNTIRNDVSSVGREEVEGLHVNSVLGAGLDDCAQDISGQTVFSTYAGALEIINNVFQPTGVDYIIHVLGDAQREKYLDDFRRGNYPYASTLKNEYTNCEYWSVRVNWYFYRELYADYVPVKETNYSVIWEKAEKQNTINTDVKVSWEYLNDASCRIEIDMSDYEDAVYVDLSLKYDTVWTEKRFAEGGLQKILCVEDGGENYNSYAANSCYYLRGQSEECTIPVYVRNGKGVVCISSNPLSCTRLENVDVGVDRIIKEPVFPLHVTYYTDIRCWAAEDGVDQAGTMLKFDNTEYATTRLEKAKLLRANGETAVVSQVWKDGDYICVLLETPIERGNFVYPNTIEVIGEEYE